MIRIKKVSGFIFCLILTFNLVFALGVNDKIKFLSDTLKKNSYALNLEKPEFSKNTISSNLNSVSLPLIVQKNNLKKFKGIKKGDLVIGYTSPDEKVTLTGEQVIAGNIIVMNSGELTFNNASVVLYGDIFVFDNGKFSVENSTLNIVSKFTYSNGMTVYGSASVNFNSSTINSNGFNWNVGIAENGSWNITDTQFENGVTTALFGNAIATVENSNPLEWVLDENSSLTLRDCPGPFMLWPVFGDGSVVDLTFPDGNHVNNFEISNSVSGIENVSCSLVIENCDNINWGMMVKKGANVTIKDSQMMTTGIMADAEDYWDITGLNNEQYFIDYTLPINQMTIRYVNTRVNVFNVYQYGADEIKLENSVIGELGVLSGTKCSVWKAMIDGTGGYFFTNSNITTTFLLSALFSHAVANEQSIDLFINSTILGGDIVARDDAVILLANTLHDHTLKAFDNAFIVDADLDIPVSESINSVIPIEGTAFIYYGEQSPVRFSTYSLSYSKADDGQNWTKITNEVSNPVENGILGFWNTTGLTPGNYTIKLTLNMNFGDPIEITKNIFLGVEGTTQKTLFIPHIDNSEYWESYLVFDNLSETYKKAKIYLFENGNFLKKIEVNVNPYEQKQVNLEGDSGFVKVGESTSVREFFVSKTEGGIAAFNLKGVSSGKINFLMPLYSADTLTWEGIAFQNVKNLNTNCNLTGYEPLSSTTYQTNVSLIPFGKSVGLVENYFNNVDYSNLSRIEVKSDSLINGIIISGKGNKSLLFTQGVSETEAGKVLIPHIANEWNTWQNFLILDNLTNAAVEINLTLFSNGNKVLDRKVYQIFPNSQIIIKLNDFKNLSPECGYVEVPNNIAVRQAFKSADGGVAEFLLSSDASYNLVLNMPKTESENLNWSGIALMNSSDSDASVTLNAYNNGELVDSVQITIPKNQRAVGVLQDFFSNLESDFIDRVEAISDQPLTGLTISGYNQEILLFSNLEFERQNK
ncbi:hypothetical protein TTHT_1346 [Thermotomaculum hydrothermale]|uniref:Uncharacterized protein n=1 Tax=Thermotomaculum hydrothermale TaxID=981385 RepID=A0A7R6PHS5_9BACT|nr:hypothetical protein [Thermotomaculum hydrothermale]BBB32859.1 hypothetical protein TTHT_1346 [Thermotomaculum hydrothermale]